jgi:hypothetical protein
MSILIIMPIRMIANTGMMMNAMPMIMIVHRSRDHDHAAGLFPAHAASSSFGVCGRHHRRHRHRDHHHACEWRHRNPDEAHLLP